MDKKYYILQGGGDFNRKWIVVKKSDVKKESHLFVSHSDIDKYIREGWQVVCKKPNGFGNYKIVKMTEDDKIVFSTKYYIKAVEYCNRKGKK